MGSMEKVKLPEGEKILINMDLVKSFHQEINALSKRKQAMKQNSMEWL